MRISDWSSDVCSSDLLRPAHHRLAADPARRARCRRRGDGDVAPGPAEGGRLERGRLAGTGGRAPGRTAGARGRSEEHTSELQSLMRISYAVLCFKKRKNVRPRYTDRKKLEHPWKNSQI